MRIHTKITLSFCVILIILITGVFLYLDTTLKEFMYKRIETTLLKEAKLASMLFTRDSGDLSVEEADSMADKAGQYLKSRVTVITLDGRVLGDSDLDGIAIREVENHLYRPEVQDAIRTGMGTSTRFSTTIKKKMLYLAVTFGKNEPVGVMRVSMPLSDIDLISVYLKKTLIGVFGVAFGIAFLASLAVSVFISKPIERISRTAGDIAKGNFSRKIPIRTKDEIGELAEAFNYMSEQISSKIGEVTESRSRLEAVLLSMFDGVMVVDSRGTILLINRTLKDLLAVEKDPIGRKPLEVLRNVDIQEITDKALVLEEGVESKEIVLLFPREKRLIVHATPIFMGDAVEGAVLLFHDITDIRKLENIRKDFVANVSHELRTPASNIKGFTETLVSGAMEEEENAREFLKIIEANSDRLIKLIDDLMSLSRIESGKTLLDLKPASLFSIAEKVVKGLRRDPSRKDIDIRNDINKSISQVYVDESLISQALFNLLDNAVKYSGGKGPIAISSDEDDDFIKVSVTDNGIGIPEDDIPRIFERFYCVDKARSREVGGTGLGLSIVKHIVEEHGGSVTVSSVLEQGSTFSIKLPRSKKV